MHRERKPNLEILEKAGELLGAFADDIVALLDGRPEIANEVRQVDGPLRKHLTTRFAALMCEEDFLAALPGHLPGDAASQARAPLILERTMVIVESR